MLKNKEAVIFDFDGTLADSMWVWPKVDIVFLGERNLEFPNDLQADIEGMSFTETAQYFKKRFKLKEEVEELKDIWNSMAYDMYANEVYLKEGAMDFLEFLKQNDIKMGIATSNSRELVLAALKNNNITDYFDCILTACDVNAGKPAPDIYLEVSKRIDISPEKCLVFEDVPMGIMAGKNANMTVCAIYDELSEELTDRIKARADYYINSYTDIFNNSYERLDKWRAYE